MGADLDNIGASLVLGALILIVLLLNETFMSSDYNQTMAAANVEVLTGYSVGTTTIAGLGGVLDYDFNTMGYKSQRSILYADTNKIVFAAALHSENNVDTISYYSSPGTNSGVTLYRKENASTGGGWQASQFRLTYYDAKGRTIFFPAGFNSNQVYCDSIRSIRVRFQGVPPAKLTSENVQENSYAAALWDKLFSPANLRAL